MSDRRVCDRVGCGYWTSLAVHGGWLELTHGGGMGILEASLHFCSWACLATYVQPRVVEAGGAKGSWSGR